MLHIVAGTVILTSTKWEFIASLSALTKNVTLDMQPSDVIKQFLNAAEIPCHLEPNGLYRSDGKRPDGVTMDPWSGIKVLVWDATCPDTLAPSYISLATREASAIAKEAEQQKKAKNSHLERTNSFIPVAVEILDVFGTEAHDFVRDLGCSIAHVTVEPLSTHYL